MDKVIFDNIRKQIRKCPVHIIRNLQRWSLMVESMGILAVRKIPGYHDEPLRGRRIGQRSIRLSKSWRAYYVEYDEDKVRIISVEEINKHEY